MWDSPNEDQRGKIYSCTLWLSFLLSLPQQEENQLPNFTQCPIFYRPSTPITVHSNVLCSFLASKYRPEYGVVSPIYFMPWLKGPTIFKVERNALAVLFTKLSANISWLWQTPNRGVPACLLPNHGDTEPGQRRQKVETKELLKKQEEETPQMDIH